MVSVFPVLLACKNLNLKDFCFWQGAQNRWVCTQPINHCTLCLSFTSDSLGRLIGQMWTCKNDWCYLSWFWAKYFLPFPWRNFFAYEWGRWAGCDLCTFYVASVSSGAQVSMIYFWPTILCLRHFTESKEISAICFGLGPTVWKICYLTSEDHYSFLKYFSLLGTCH